MNKITYKANLVKPRSKTLFINGVIDLSVKYKLELPLAIEYFKGVSTTKLVYLFKRHIGAGEILNSLGMQPVRNQACPWHPSKTKADFNIFEVDDYGKLPFFYHRFKCFRHAGCSHPKGDMLDLISILCTFRNMREIACLMLYLRKSGELPPIPLKASHVKKGGKHSMSESYYAQLVDLYNSVEAEFPKEGEKVGVTYPLKGIGMSAADAFRALFTESEGRLFVVDSPKYREMRTRDQWLRRGITYMSHVSQGYLQEDAVDTGEESFRERLWLIVEGDSDRVGISDQIEVHNALDGFLGFPLALTCWSGNQSIHGWYDARGRTEEECFRFYCEAVRRGMDPACFKQTQPVRLPGGYNNITKRMQSILEWNKKVI